MLPLFQAEQFKIHSLSTEAAALDLKLPAVKVISYSGLAPGNGEPTSLESVVKQLQAKVSWFALTGAPEVSNANSTIAFYKPSVARSVLEQHGNFCANYLLPLLHESPTKGNFDLSEWKSFRQLSAIIASESLSVATESFPTLCWVHDYQIPFVAPIMSLHAGTVLCHFWHSPWPGAQFMADSQIGVELVEALLANRLIGFQTTEYASNFLNTVQTLVPTAVVDVLKMEVKHNRAISRVVVAPFGIDNRCWQEAAKQSRPLAHVLSRKYKQHGPLILGVDRLDASKGIIEKLAGLEEFIANSPHWLKRFQYVQITFDSAGMPTSSYKEQVEQRIAAINATGAKDGWQPIVHLHMALTQNELAAWYQAADIFAINSIRDGVSLVAKEFIACRQEENGILLLSKTSGSAPELAQGAILVDPLSRTDFASALLNALTLNSGENRRRMLTMNRTVSRNNLEDWAVSFLRQALAVQPH